MLPMAMGSTIGKMEVFIRVILSKESDMAMVSGRIVQRRLQIRLRLTIQHKQGERKVDLFRVLVERQEVT